jgi:hypothetical protein
MTGWCWDMRDEPYEDEDEDGVINGASARADGTTVVASGLPTRPAPQRVVQ